MSKPHRASQNKKNRQRAQAEKQQQKRDDRSFRKEQKKNRPDSDSGVDPDLVGIFPGPQPTLD